jgi:hypothetical protein
VAELTPPLRSEPLVDDNNAATLRFIEYLENVAVEVNDISPTTTVTASSAWQGQQLQQKTFAAVVSAYISAMIPTTKEFNGITKSSNYTMLSFDFVNAKNGVTLKFPPLPGANDLVKARNGDGIMIRLDGNGKKLNGKNEEFLRRKGELIEWQYFIETDEWFAT